MQSKHEELRMRLKAEVENHVKSGGHIQQCVCARDTGGSRGKVNAGSMEELAEARDELSSFDGEESWEM